VTTPVPPTSTPSIAHCPNWTNRRSSSVLGRVVDDADDFELLAPVRLSVVCFRYRPAGGPLADLDALNHRLGEALIEDGRVYAGTTTYRAMTALRPAMVNWRTTEPDVDLLVSVLRELGPGLIRSTTR
jgi:glutamate/tyrosine decarboxylase-like PLP-dependent enzyme